MMLDKENIGRLFDLRAELHSDIFKMKELFCSFNDIASNPYDYSSACMLLIKGYGKKVTAKLREEICSEINDIRYDIKVLNNSYDSVDGGGLDLDLAKFSVDSALERLQTLRCWYLRYKYLGEQKQ